MLEFKIEKSDFVYIYLHNSLLKVVLDKNDVDGDRWRIRRRERIRVGIRIEKE